MALPRVWRRGRRDRELAAELDLHLAREIEDGLEAGLSREEASRRAHVKIGNTTRIREDVRGLYSLGALERFGGDLRHAVRVLRASPAFTLAAILSLALGIGANTAIFELLDAVRLRTLPVVRPGELAEVVVDGGTGGLGLMNSDFAQATYPLWDEIRRRQSAFSRLFAWGTTDFEIGREGTSHRVRGLWVSGSLFPTLQLRAWRGRLLDEHDDVRGCGPGPVVVSHAYWERELAGDDAAIGRSIVLDGQRVVIAGVTPPGFRGFVVGSRFDVAVPLCAAAVWNRDALDQRNAWWLVVMGRLQRGWSVERASAHIAALAPGLMSAVVPAGYDPVTTARWRTLRLAVRPADRGVSYWRTQYESSLWLLFGATGLVLLLACANLSTLMLARASARAREFALRVAIGASRARLVSQGLAESLLLSAAGGVIGTGVAVLGSRGLVSFVSTDNDPLVLDLGADRRVLAFTALLSVITCVMCGLLPSWRAAGAEPAAALKSGGRVSLGPSHGAAQRALIVVQVALSVVLVTGALLFVRSLQNLLTLDAGFRQDGIAFSILSLSNGADRPQPDAVQAARVRLLERVRALPDIESAATSTHLPLSDMSWGFEVRVPHGRGQTEGSSRFTWVSPGYFATMGIGLRGGRDFDLHDQAASGRVLVVNEAFVRQFFAGMRPIGSRVRSLAEPGYPETEYEVVGVVRDTKYMNLRDEVPPIAFAPVSQNPSPARWSWTLLAMRTRAPVSVLKPELEGVVRQIGVRSDVVVWPFATQIRERLLRERLMSWLSGFFGGLAIALAAIGIYGVVAYGVSRRSHELAIRLALGAGRSRIVRMVVGDAASVLARGLALGLVGVLVAGRTARALLFGLEPSDPVTIAMGLAVLAAIGLAAAWVPAARASGASVLDGLRAD